MPTVKIVNNQYIVSNFVNCYAAKPSSTNHFGAPSELVRHFLDYDHRPVPAKDQAELFSCVSYSGKGRRKSNCELVGAVVLDINQITDGQAENMLAVIEPYIHCIYTTYSSTYESWCFRVILPLAEPIPAADYERLKVPVRVAQMLGVPITLESAQVTRLFYMPSHFAGHEREDQILHGETNGKLLTLDELPELASPHTFAECHADEIYEKNKALADQVFWSNYFGRLFYCSHVFWTYQDGIWLPVESEQLVSDIFVKVFQERRSPKLVDKLVRIFKVKLLKPEFPKPRQTLCHVVLDNATVDMMTGIAQPHSHENYARNKMNFSFDPDAKCPKWMQFLLDIFGTDEEGLAKIRLLQEFIGYSFTSLTHLHASLWLIGQGSNGKSVITKVIQGMLTAANYSALSIKDLSCKFRLAELDGKLVNFTHELPAGFVMEEDTFKKIVSGDTLTLEQKNKKPYFATLVAKLWFSTNHFPIIKDNSDGLKRRMILLPFTKRISEAERVLDLDLTFVDEYSGIFNWAMEGFQQLMKRGRFLLPESSKTELNDYMLEADPVAQFLREHTRPFVPTAKNSIPPKAAEVYEAYCVFCKASGYTHPMPRSLFGRQLKLHGLETKKSNGQMRYLVEIINQDALPGMAWSSYSKQATEHRDIEEIAL